MPRGDWSLQAARWVTRAGGGEPSRASPFKDIRSLADRAAEISGTAALGDAGPPSKADKKLVSALDYAKCSAVAEVGEIARRAMEMLARRVQGRPNVKIQGSGQAVKILYKDLQISVIKGPIVGRPEVSVSFFRGIEHVADADGQLEEFVRILSGLGTNVERNEDGRRTLTLGGAVIGLPVRNPFTGGVRFRILEPSGAGGQRSVMLDSECMDALNTVLQGEERTGFGTAVVDDDSPLDQMQRLFRPKYAAYGEYRRVAAERRPDSREVNRENERRAAFTAAELVRLIEFLQQRLKVNISPTTTVFAVASGLPAVLEPPRPVYADAGVQREEEPTVYSARPRLELPEANISGSRDRSDLDDARKLLVDLGLDDLDDE
jgi:hypothetical protein